MTVVILLIALAVHFVIRLTARASITGMLIYMREKGYTLPTVEESKACTQKALNLMFGRYEGS